MRKSHETTAVLRAALELNKMSCSRIYSYDGKTQVNSKAWVLSNKKKLSSLKKTVNELDSSMTLKVLKNHRGTSLRIVKSKEQDAA